MHRRLKIYLGVVTVLGAISFLIISAVQGAAMYYMTVDEALAGEPARTGQAVRMRGKIDHSSVSFDMRRPLLRFQARGEEGGAIWVEFRGVRPDNMAEAVEAIFEGKINSAGVFQAETLMITCPNTYQSGGSQSFRARARPQVRSGD